MTKTYFVWRAHGRLKVKDDLESLESAKECMKAELKKEYDEILKLGGKALIRTDYPDEKKGYVIYWMPTFGRRFKVMDYGLGINILSKESA